MIGRRHSEEVWSYLCFLCLIAKIPHHTSTSKTAKVYIVPELDMHIASLPKNYVDLFTLLG